MSELENHDYEAARLEIEIEQLQAEAAAMRAALEVVMWDELETGARYCIWCAVMFGSDHLSDCQGNNALAADAGRELLERLQAEAAAMRTALEAIAKTETGYTEGDFATSCDCTYCLDMQEIAEKALAADVGRDLLERLRRAERERDEAQERIKQLKREIPARTFDIEDYQEVY